MESGIFRAKPLGAALGETSKGAEQVGIEFELLDLPGHRMTYFGTFGEKAVEHTLKALRLSGWQGDDLSDLSSVGAADCEVSLVVENEEYEGKTRARIRWVNAPGGLAMKNPLTPDKAKAFAARMRGTVLALSKTAPKPTRGGVLSPEPPPITADDGIPF